MNYFSIEKRKSLIHGVGLFTREFILRRSLVINWVDQGRIISERDHLTLIAENEFAAKNSVRLCGSAFIIGESEDATDSINHSTSPNLLYFNGLCFSARDIQPEEELTIDYRFLNSETQIDVVRGFSNEIALRQSAKVVIEIVAIAERVAEKPE